MSDLINPNVSEQKMQKLAALVANYMRLHSQFGGTVAPEIHRGAFEVALKLASAYPCTRGGADNTIQSIQLAIELLDRAYKLVPQGVPMADEEPIPNVWFTS